MDDLRDRVAAIERALSDGEGDPSALTAGAANPERVTDLEREVDSLREEVDELAAATQALRGYVGNVRSVNDSVEERADAAMAAVDSLETRVDRLESADSPEPSTGSAVSEPTGSAPNEAGPASEHCRACGRPTDDGSAPRPEPAPDSPEEDGLGNGVPAATVGGFDPDDPGRQVRVRRDGGPDPPASEAVGTADDGDAHVLDRVRDLL